MFAGFTDIFCFLSTFPQLDQRNKNVNANNIIAFTEAITRVCSVKNVSEETRKIYRKKYEMVFYLAKFSFAKVHYGNNR